MDKWVSFNQRRIVEKIPLNGKTVLDVGCGRGDYLKIFAEKLGRENVAGLDIFKAALPGIRAFKGTAEKLPFRDNEFDIVFEKDTLHHVKNKKKALWEMKRVAKKEVVLVEANAENGTIDRFIDKRFHKHFSPETLAEILNGEQYLLYFVEAFPFGSNRLFPLKIFNFLPSFVMWPVGKIFDLLGGKRAAFMVCRISC